MDIRYCNLDHAIRWQTQTNSCLNKRSADVYVCVTGDYYWIMWGNKVCFPSLRLNILQGTSWCVDMNSLQCWSVLYVYIQRTDELTTATSKHPHLITKCSATESAILWILKDCKIKNNAFTRGILGWQYNYFSKSVYTWWWSCEAETHRNKVYESDAFETVVTCVYKMKGKLKGDWNKTRKNKEM